MKQVLQSYRTGELWLAEVPAPALQEHGVIVRTAASAVSAGTERMLIELAGKSFLGKAYDRPDLVRKVLNKIKTEGLASTFEKVLAKLDAPVPLGYSCAGTVVEVGSAVPGLRPGDRVACAGAGYASHAEYNYVPHNLCSVIPDGIGFDQAAFTTLGAIAMQGVRQADVRLGENVAVIGLGLLGLLTVQLLKAAGCRVIGADPDAARCKLAEELGADVVVVDGLRDTALSFTNGRGVDAALITAAAKSNEPLELAGAISRIKGRVVAVGMIGMNVPRDEFYKKELEIRTSTSYGPGRYDPNYEERGNDYPYGYVRWTEQRNMSAFLGLVAEGRVNTDRLVTHRFSIDEALNAYELFKSPSQETGKNYLGILIQYPASGKERVAGRTIELSRTPTTGGVGVGLIGAGNFARGILLPALKSIRDVRFVGLCTNSGMTASETGRKSGFAAATTDPDELLGREDINAILIATRHGSHADLVCRALKAGKNVFVEKPLAISAAQLEEIEQTCRTRPAAVLMVGYNRRFSPHATSVKRAFHALAGPTIVLCRVNAGASPRDHWIHDPHEGGGRIIGEVCHFVDLCEFLADSPIVEIFAASVRTRDTETAADENISVAMRHESGSMSSIQYIAVGSNRLAKERIEVHQAGKSAVIDDFRSTTFFGLRERTVRGRQNKGFTEELAAFVAAVRDGNTPPIPVDSLIRTTRATFAIIESLKTGKPIPV